MRRKFDTNQIHQPASGDCQESDEKQQLRRAFTVRMSKKWAKLMEQSERVKQTALDSQNKEEEEEVEFSGERVAAQPDAPSDPTGTQHQVDKWRPSGAKPPARKRRRAAKGAQQRLDGAAQMARRTCRGQEEDSGRSSGSTSPHPAQVSSGDPNGAGEQPQAKSQATQNVCAACSKPIRERYLLEALDKRWHEDCLKCACCDCRLGEVGSSLFTHSDKILCRRDFLRIFGQHGHCAACKRSIPPYELVMRANENAYHMDCFNCQQCQYRFCVGDRFHLTEAQRIVCLLCHTEMTTAAAAVNSASGEPAQLRQVSRQRTPPELGEARKAAAFLEASDAPMEEPSQAKQAAVPAN